MNLLAETRHCQTPRPDLHASIPQRTKRSGLLWTDCGLKRSTTSKNTRRTTFGQTPQANLHASNPQRDKRAPTEREPTLQRCDCDPAAVFDGRESTLNDRTCEKTSAYMRFLITSCRCSIGYNSCSLRYNRTKSLCSMRSNDILCNGYTI